MTQKQFTKLFNTDLSVVSRHLKNIYSENELEDSTFAKFARVQLVFDMTKIISKLKQ